MWVMPVRDESLSLVEPAGSFRSKAVPDTRNEELEPPGLIPYGRRQRRKPAYLQSYEC